VVNRNIKENSLPQIYDRFLIQLFDVYQQRNALQETIQKFSESAPVEFNSKQLPFDFFYTNLDKLNNIISRYEAQQKEIK